MENLTPEERQLLDILLTDHLGWAMATLSKMQDQRSALSAADWAASGGDAMQDEATRDRELCLSLQRKLAL